MSRSRKKIGYCGDKQNKQDKRNANKAVNTWLKQNPELNLNGSSYKKASESYDIRDFWFTCEWEEYWKNVLEFDPSANKKEAYRDWITLYKTK